MHGLRNKMSAKNKKLVEKILGEFEKRNNNFFSDYLADDIQWEIVGMPVIYGKINFLKAIKTLELNNFILINVKNIISEGDYVVVESISKLPSQNENSEDPASCDIYHIKQGKIQQLTTYIVDTTSE